MRKTLEVTGRPLTYATRRLKPGDTFSAPDPHARLLIRLKRARVARPPAEIPPPPPELLAKFDHDGDGQPGGSAAPAPSDRLKALRAEYTAKLGKRPFPGWDAETLAQKIAENG